MFVHFGKQIDKWQLVCDFGRWESVYCAHMHFFVFQKYWECKRVQSDLHRLYNEIAVIGRNMELPKAMLISSLVTSKCQENTPMKKVWNIEI